jgi:lipopolysaccharide/colanic/teichoic acid biosynthesis glycosyltransferase
MRAKPWTNSRSLNVIKGDIILIFPTPLLPKYLACIAKSKTPSRNTTGNDRLGTGKQVMQSWQKNLNIENIDNLDLFFDCIIIFLTIKSVEN